MPTRLPGINLVSCSYLASDQPDNRDPWASFFHFITWGGGGRPLHIQNRSGAFPHFSWIVFGFIKFRVCGFFMIFFRKFSIHHCTIWEPQWSATRETLERNGLLVEHIGGKFDLMAFNVILESFSAPPIFPKTLFSKRCFFCVYVFINQTFLAIPYDNPN